VTAVFASLGGTQTNALTLTGVFGAVYQIDGSTDLSEWTPLGKVTNDWGTVQFTDGTGTNRPQRFYRALALP
jgi:hypothetical protein